MKTWQALATAALLWAAVFLPGLGTPELKGEEARRVLPGRTMLETGEWVVPYVGGKPYGRKPPLVNWLAAASFRLTGVCDEWSARLPSVLAVLVLALGTILLGARWPGVPASLMAAVFMMTNLAVLEKGRLAEIEPLYISLTGLAFVWWSVFWVRGRSSWLCYLVPGALLGLGILAKGPLNLLFFYAPVIAILHRAGRKRELASPGHLASLALMAGLVLPWALAFRRRVAELVPPDRRADKVWLDQLTQRLDPGKFELGSWLATPIEAALNFAPWVFLLAVLWWWFRRRDWPVPDEPGMEAGHHGNGNRHHRPRHWARGCVLGLVLSFLGVAFIPESMERYTHPAFGPASLLTAVLAGAMVPGPFARRVRRGWFQANRILLAAAALGALVALSAPFIPVEAVNSVPTITLAAGIVGATLAVVAGWRINNRNGTHPDIAAQGDASRTAGLAVATACAAAGAMMLYGTLGVTAATARDDVRPVAAAIRDALPADGARLCVLNPGIQPILFYLPAASLAVVARTSRIPDRTTHLLVGERTLEKAARTKHFQSFGFKKTNEFIDKRGQRLWLMETGR